MKHRQPFGLKLNLFNRHKLLMLACFASIFAACFGLIAKATPQQIELRFLSWADYVSPFEKQFLDYIQQKYGISLRLKIINVVNPGEFLEAARSNSADLISPAHNIPKSLRWPLVAQKLVLPVNLKNVPNFRYVLKFLKNSRFVVSSQKVYGVPYSMGPYGLAYNTKLIKTPPNSWNVLWDPKYTGKYSITGGYPDCNIYIAALSIGAKYDELYHVEKILAGREAHLRSKLHQLARGAHSLWEGVANFREFPKLALAATWGYAVSKANQAGGSWKMAYPKEGTTLWVDHWLITKAVKDNPLKKAIAEDWINFSLGKAPQIALLREWGVSPVVNHINEYLTDEEIKTFHVGNSRYFEKLSLWENQDRRTQNAYEVFWQEALRARKEQGR